MTSHNGLSGPIELEMHCTLSGPVLQILRVFVETVARQMGFEEHCVTQIEMAVDEACSNVLLHAYPGSGLPRDTCHPESEPLASAITLRMHIEDDALGIWIIDHGVGALGGPHRGVESVEEYLQRQEKYHGLGTYIIRSFMDEVEYDYPSGKGTVVRMKKYLRPATSGQ